MWEHLTHFFSPAPAGLPLVEGQYQPALVLLSVLVAVALSWLALQMAEVAQRTGATGQRRATLLAGALALGSGIWTMHFIGMFAYQLPAPLRYHSQLTLLSMLPTFFAAWAALAILTRKKITRLPLLGSGFILGAGIGTMHYGGMLAIETPLRMQHDPGLFALSIVVAVVLGTLAIGIRYGLAKLMLPKRLRFWLSGLIMGCAIAGMHYTAMAAVRFYGQAQATDSGYYLDRFLLALGVAAIAIAIAMTVTALNGLYVARRLNKEISTSKKRLITILDTADDGIITINQRGLIQEFSHAAERLFGYQASEVRGRNINILMPEPYHSQHNDYLARYKQTRQAHVIGVGAEAQGMRKDGTVFPLRISVGEVDTEEGRIYVGVLSDISARKSLEKSLREAVKKAEQAAQAKTHFLANMSHEIRTPMNAIMGFTEILLQGELNTTQREHLQIIRQSSRSLLGLLNDILDSSKLESGKITLEIASFSLSTLAQQIENTFSLSAKQKQLQLLSEIAPNTPDIFQGDFLRIVQILTNLVGNAIKFTEQGQIKIRYTYADALLRIHVQDTGIGMSAEQIEKIFEPFTQADASISRRFGGTGLGTTIARQLAQAMGGNIHVHSTLAQGSDFCVELPLPFGQAVPNVSPVAEFILPPLRILIADDMAQNRELLRLVLENQHHQVTQARDGEEAQQLFQIHAFDVVLMDVHMPHLDGLSATRAIRIFEQQQQRQSTPIIALTASVMAEDRQKTQEAGMNGFAVKPLDPPALFAEIARVLGYSGQGQNGPTPASASIHWQRGENLWGSRTKLQQAIAEFIRDYAQNYPLLQRSSAPEFNAETLPDLIRQAHSLKGVSGNLALLELSECAGEIERLAKENRLLAMQLELQKLWQIKQRLHEQFQPPLAPINSAETPSAAFNKSALQQLILLLQHHEINDPAIDAVTAFLSTHQAKELREAIAAFDFKKALFLLESWLQDKE